MRKYSTHKRTSEGRRETLRRRELRAAKYGTDGRKGGKR